MKAGRSTTKLNARPKAMTKSFFPTIYFQKFFLWVNNYIFQQSDSEGLSKIAETFPLSHVP